MNYFSSLNLQRINKITAYDYEETKLLRIFLEKVIKTFKYHLCIVCFDFMDVFYRDCAVN